jgi:hypothetical protein
METKLEHILTSTHKAGMIAYMHAHPEAYKEAVELAVSDKQPYSWRAAWLLWSCMEKNDRHIKGSINKIIKAITTREDGHQRELLKILEQMDLKEEHEGFLFDLCVSIWKKINKKPSVRFTALRFLIKIAKKHPELFHEIELLTENQYMASLSPGVKRSVARMKKELAVH